MRTGTITVTIKFLLASRILRECRSSPIAFQYAQAIRRCTYWSRSCRWYFDRVPFFMFPSIIMERLRFVPSCKSLILLFTTQLFPTSQIQVFGPSIGGVIILFLGASTELASYGLNCSVYIILLFISYSYSYLSSQFAVRCFHAHNMKTYLFITEQEIDEGRRFNCWCR